MGLITLDPPVNSNAGYNVLFTAPDGSGNGAAAEMLRAMRGFLDENDMMADLAMMAARLIELNRVLKATGSVYLHCKPKAKGFELPYRQFSI